VDARRQEPDALELDTRDSAVTDVVDGEHEDTLNGNDDDDAGTDVEDASSAFRSFMRSRTNSCKMVRRVSESIRHWSDIESVTACMCAALVLCVPVLTVSALRCWLASAARSRATFSRNFGVISFCSASSKSRSWARRARAGPTVLETGMEEDDDGTCEDMSETTHARGDGLHDADEQDKTNRC
jgi:hypothetical protein